MEDPPGGKLLGGLQAARDRQLEDEFILFGLREIGPSTRALAFKFRSAESTVSVFERLRGPRVLVIPASYP